MPILSARPTAPAIVLYDQYNNNGNDYVVSHARSDNPSLTAQAADDFVVPSGQEWTVQAVDFYGTACVADVNVFFYTNAGNLPGTEIVSQPNRPLSGTAPDLSVSLTPVVLNPGTYWVSVQCNANWGWQMRSVQSNSPAAWREAGGYATGCTAWTNRGTCSGTSGTPDQMFRLQGTTSAAVLRDQYDNEADAGIASQVRADSPTANAQAADDFVVPSGQAWSLLTVDFRGLPGFSCGASVNVSVYTNAGNLPGTEVASQANRPLSDGTEPDLSVSLSPAVVLNPGTYWVSVQCNTSGANWYWKNRAVQSNSAAAWRQAGAFGSACTTWGNRGTCTATADQPDQMFRLWGTIGSPTSVRALALAAKVVRGGVLVRWRAAAGADILGFNVWRQRTGGALLKVNRALIPKGDAAYSFTDTTVRRRGPYTYRLQVLTPSGYSWAGATSVRLRR